MITYLYDTYEEVITADASATARTAWFDTRGVLPMGRLESLVYDVTDEKRMAHWDVLRRTQFNTIFHALCGYVTPMGWREETAKWSALPEPDRGYIIKRWCDFDMAGLRIMPDDMRRAGVWLSAKNARRKA